VPASATKAPLRMAMLLHAMPVVAMFHHMDQEISHSNLLLVRKTRLMIYLTIY
jgi:hypothetical protein